MENIGILVLGKFVQKGTVAKLADDLYVGGNTEEEVLQNWSEVLEALKQNNLRLSAHKTIICPASATLLGWTWSQGTITASPHKLSALSTVKAPSTVQGLRSGEYANLAVMSKGDELCAGEQALFVFDYRNKFH